MIQITTRISKIRIQVRGDCNQTSRYCNQINCCRFSSILDSVGSEEEGRGEARAGSSSSMGKKERFFWQYNVQAKGPKGQKISLAPETVDPHVLNKVQDPVFSPYCSVDGIKHRWVATRFL